MPAIATYLETLLLCQLYRTVFLPTIQWTFWESHPIPLLRSSSLRSGLLPSGWRKLSARPTSRGPSPGRFEARLSLVQLERYCYT